MFERYTEKARRTIFFGRYEASQFGSPYIETEHLLLGILREDKPLAQRFLHSHATVESIREKIEGRGSRGEKVSTSVDLPLSDESKRVLVFGAEESARLKHDHIGTGHLLLGLLREEKCFAAQLLGEHGVTLEAVRESLLQAEPPPPKSGSALFARVGEWLAGVPVRLRVKQTRGVRGAMHFAIYKQIVPAEKLAQIQNRVDSLTESLENAIANHEFEKARFYSDEERKERENMGLLREQFNLEEPPPRVPLLCIEVLGDESFSEVQKHCDDSIAEGVAQIWLLDPHTRRAYTVNKAEGMREFKGEKLRTEQPSLEMDLKTIFE
jgi:hypothetical protein